MKRRFIPFLFCCFLLMACPPLPHRVMSIFKIEYSSVGRGGSEYIHIENKKLTYIKNQQDTITRKLRRKHHTELYRLFLKTPIDSLEHVTVPSKKHQFDGASATTFTVIDTASQKEYRSPIFDDDNPPEALKELILYIKELTEK